MTSAGVARATLLITLFDNQPTVLSLLRKIVTEIIEKKSLLDSADLPLLPTSHSFFLPALRCVRLSSSRPGEMTPRLTFQAAQTGTQRNWLAYI